jgi:pSer/pThr/pTyr-binding forkhead associated (FHA) protein
MAASPLTPHLGTPLELKERIAAERAGTPFLVYRDDQGAQQILFLGDGSDLLTIGRADECDVRLAWDGAVSLVHAELRHVSGHWLAVDDGLSRNGSFVNGERVHGRRRLCDQDQITVGRTVLVFRAPLAARPLSTQVTAALEQPELSPGQRRVLVALCRPYRTGAQFPRPSTNRQIADELTLTVAAVKAHLRALFERFGLQDLPQNEKRARLVQAAFESGAVSPADLLAPSS